MPLSPAINTSVTITSVGIGGVAVASTFNKVIGLHYDYFKGTINIVDSEQGSFFFGLTTITSIVTTVVGTTVIVVIS